MPIVLPSLRNPGKVTVNRFNLNVAFRLQIKSALLPFYSDTKKRRGEKPEVARTGREGRRGIIVYDE